MGSARNNNVKSVKKAITLIEVLCEVEGARVTTLAESLDWPPSTVHSYLSSLEDEHLVVKEGDTYQLGLRFLTFGGHASNRKDVYKISKEKVKELAHQTDERVQFVVEEHGRGIYVKTETGSRAVQVNAKIGKRNWLHASSAGKAILANLPPDRIEEIVEQWGLKQLTENTITDIDVLYAELERIKEEGYSTNLEESIRGLRAVGAPILDKDDTVIGALSVSGPTNRLTGDWFEKELPQLLKGTTNEIELSTRYDNY